MRVQTWPGGGPGAEGGVPCETTKMSVSRKKKNDIAQGNCNMYITDTHTKATEDQEKNRLALLWMTKLTHEKGLNLVMP